VSRAHLPSLIVLFGAIAAGAAAFVVVGRMAGALYGAAAVILGLIFQQKLARGDRVGEDTPVEPPAAARRTRRLPVRLPRGGKAALSTELARVTAELDVRQKASTELARELDDQRDRTDELQALFTERVNELSHSLDLQSLELSSERAAHAERLAARETEIDHVRQQLAVRESEVGRTRRELAESEAAFAEQTRQLELERLSAGQLADRLAEVTAAYREEIARLAWSWRAHVEEIAALEAAVDAALRMS
jgi:Skp family chaperone for outer membrane proteins